MGEGRMHLTRFFVLLKSKKSKFRKEEIFMLFHL